ncbi:MAG TPA: PQQ-binding-like beta-propeller repeat protein [Ktedonobacterales bacterium]|nr:PQQ-binding-like beta-propeller repeat protein [Ktedonobacterales bacterium]
MTRMFSFKVRNACKLLAIAVIIGSCIVATLRAPVAHTVFAYAPAISVSGYPGPGDTVDVNGSGWPVRDSITILYDAQQLATAKVGFELGIVGQPIGAFRVPVVIPTNTITGGHTITVNDVTAGLTQQTGILVKAEWRQLGFTADGTRFNPYETTIGPANVNQLTLDWSYNTGYTGQVYPSVAEDDLVVSNQAAEYLTNLNATTGQQLWQVYPENAESQPAVANGVIYETSLYLEARTVATGAMLWESDYLIFNSDPVVANGMVYATAQGGSAKLYAFSQGGCGQATCQPVWSYTGTGGVIGTPTVVNGHLFIGGSQLTALNPTSGALQWTGTITTGETTVAAMVDHNMVYFAANSTSNGGTLYAFSVSGCGQKTCSPVWSVYNPHGWGRSPAAANGILYIGSVDTSLYAFAEANCSSSSCAPIWEGSSNRPVIAPPAVANGVVYDTLASGTIVAFNASGCGSATCSSLWSHTLSAFYDDAGPTVANGMLYVSNDAGMLYAFHLPSTASTCIATRPRRGGCGGTVTAAGGGVIIP